MSKKTGIHHTAVFRTKKSQLLAVNRYHKNKNWGTTERPYYQKKPSSLGWYIVYNEFVDVDGKRTKCRAENEETLANKGHNCDVPERCDIYSVCFALDGNRQVLNEQQEKTLIDIQKERGEELELHRNIQANRICPGKRMTLDYLNGIIKNTQQIFISNPLDNEKEKSVEIRRLQSELDTYRVFVSSLLKIIKNKYANKKN